jgi:hypothetical protein
LIGHCHVRRTAPPCSLRASDGSALLSAALAMKTFRSQAPRNSFDGISRAFCARGKDCVRHEASRLAVIETPNSAGEIMTKDVVSVLTGSSVRDVAILLLEKRISAVPVLAANLQLLGMVSEGPATAARKRTPDGWLTSARSPSGKRANRLRVSPPTRAGLFLPHYRMGRFRGLARSVAAPTRNCPRLRFQGRRLETSARVDLRCGRVF